MVERRRNSADGMPDAAEARRSGKTADAACDQVPASATSSAGQPAAAPVQEGRVRAVVDALLPSVDGGRFAPKIGCAPS
jgi:hypothetical protein